MVNVFLTLEALTKKKMKLAISISLIIMHIATLCYFLSLDYSYLNEHKAMRIIFFVCPAFILPSLNNEFRSENDDKWQLLTYSIHNLFSLLIGSVYFLYYTGVIWWTTKYSIFIGSVIFFVIFISIYYNLLRYGFLKRRK